MTPKKQLPKISASEWQIATVVWETAGLTAADIDERLGPRSPWKIKTINTFLVRLVRKGILRIDRSERAYRYFARMAREDCVQAESQSFLGRVFGGAVAPMLAHFCETADLTDEDVAQLRQILNERPPRKTRRKEK